MLFVRLFVLPFWVVLEARRGLREPGGPCPSCGSG